MFDSVPAKNAAESSIEHLEQATRADPSDPRLLNELGGAYRELHRYEEALAAYGKALELKPDYAEALYGRGVVLLDLMRNDEAIASCRKALSLNPDIAEAHYKLGVALSEQGKSHDAIDAYRSALSLKPDYAEAHNNLGILLRNEGRLDEAIGSYQKALSLNPGLAEAHLNLGNALMDLDRPRDAIASYRKAGSCRPGYADAHFNLGNALKRLDRLEEARASYSEALLRRPHHAEAHNGLGSVFHMQGNLGEAMASYRRAISFAPDLAEAHLNFGSALHEQDKLQEALRSYRHALLLRPDFAEARLKLGDVLRDCGDLAGATASYGSALSTNPELAEARWSMAMCALPAVYGYGVSPSACRAEFEVAIADLETWFRGERVAEGYRSVGRQLPFNLAYQEENNKPLLSRYGALCSRLMAEWLQRQNLQLPEGQQPSAAIEVGIVSRYFSNHSVWHAIVKGWLQNLDKRRFRLHLFHLGTAQDVETAYARRHAATFTGGPRSLKGWVDAICAKRFDALVYPEVGMDPMTVRLASMRLASVQVCAWGHPETTGLPSMDYYLSAEDFEPEGADAYYTERLIKLPGLGCFYSPASTQPAEPAYEALGINQAVPLLICPGVPYKYAPQHDRIFVDIARKVGKCQFIFFTPKPRELGLLLRDRLNSVFAQAGLRAEDFVLTIPWQEKPAFYGLMRRADVYLDTIGFSGFNTAMQAVECGLPIVTQAGRFLRGRFAAGILSRMDLSELVAPTDEEYVALAVRLATDRAYRESVRERMRKSRNILFGDVAPITALEHFLGRGVSAGNAAGPGA